jgi:hypothetical protein
MNLAKRDKLIIELYQVIDNIKKSEKSNNSNNSNNLSEEEKINKKRIKLALKNIMKHLDTINDDSSNNKELKDDKRIVMKELYKH